MTGIEQWIPQGSYKIYCKAETRSIAQIPEILYLLVTLDVCGGTKFSGSFMNSQYFSRNLDLTTIRDSLSISKYFLSEFVNFGHSGKLSIPSMIMGSSVTPMFGFLENIIYKIINILIALDNSPGWTFLPL